MPEPFETDVTPTVERVNLTEVTEPLALRIGALMARVWPKLEKDAAFRAARLIEQGASYEGPPERAPHAFVIREAGGDADGVVIARAANSLRYFQASFSPNACIRISTVSCIVPEA